MAGNQLKLYFFLGEPIQRRNGAEVRLMVPEGIKHIERPSRTLYSPRISGSDGQMEIDTGSTQQPTRVYYASTAQFNDIYEFVFTCRASKRTENYYLLGIPDSIADFEERAMHLGGPMLYNLVSGDKLPPPVPNDPVRRYLAILLHYFDVYHKAGLGNSKVIQFDDTSQPRIVSAGGHTFKEEWGWALSISTVPVGILIDWYRIESGVIGMNSQLSFVKDPEFRFLVYNYIKTLFVALIRHSSDDEEDRELLEHYPVPRLINKAAALIAMPNGTTV